MAKQYIPILQSNYNKTNMKGASNTQLVNLYLEAYPQAVQNRPNVAALYTPGLELLIDLSGNVVRSLFEWKGNGYAVVDNKVYKIENMTTTPSSTLLGTISTGVGRISVTATIEEIVWCDGANVYSYDGSTFSDITASVTTNMGSAVPIFVTSKDGFVIYVTDTDSTAYVSDLLDASTVAALSSFQTNSSYDTLVSAISSNTYIYFFGTQSTEIWYNAGTAIQPLARVSNGVVQYGNVAPHSAVEVADNIYFLSQSKEGILGIAVMNGTQVQIISNSDFVSKILSYNSIEDAFGWVDIHDGHTFYNITFPNAETIIGSTTIGKTWSIDITSGAIFERRSYDTFLLTDHRHKANCKMAIGQLQVVGDFQTGKLYEISKDYYDDDGETITRTIVSPNLKDRDLFISVYSLDIDVERGIGINGDGQGSEPEIMLEVSKTEGRTWGNKLFRSLGTIGDYNRHIRFSSLGGGRSITLRLTMSDPVPWAIYSVTAELEKGETN